MERWKYLKAFWHKDTDKLIHYIFLRHILLTGSTSYMALSFPMATRQHFSEITETRTASTHFREFLIENYGLIWFCSQRFEFRNYNNSQGFANVCRNVPASCSVEIIAQVSWAKLNLCQNLQIDQYFFVCSGICKNDRLARYKVKKFDVIKKKLPVSNRLVY